MSEEIRIERRGEVELLTIDRPEARNALTHQTYAELERAVRDTTARCLVITGRDPAFCSGDDVKKVTAQTLLVWGDSDMMRPEHMVEVYKMFGGGQRDAGWQRENISKNRLAILPNATHYDIFMSPGLVPTVLPFLDGNTAAPTWEAQVAKQ